MVKSFCIRLHIGFVAAKSVRSEPSFEHYRKERSSLRYYSIYWAYFCLVIVELCKNATEIGTFHKNPVTTFLPSSAHCTLGLLVLRPCVQNIY